MSRLSSLDGRTNTHLPAEFWPSHQLCFVLHDAMTQLLVSGERAKAFFVKFDLSEEDAASLRNASDVFDWLDSHRPFEDRAAVLLTTLFPAILSDMLHCIYEAMETSRKAKLGISFMLLRKPLQEALYVLEAAIADRSDFARKLMQDPVKLWSQGAGGREAHTKNIEKVLEAIGESRRFDASYLAQLRYDKDAPDGFDGICNKATHLFTHHQAIRTEPMNINFIFSDWDSKETQWSYIYSRLPYLLAYMHSIVEYVCAQIAPTTPLYTNDMKRRISALILLWWPTVDTPYADNRLRSFVGKTKEWLYDHCQAAGFRTPTENDLIRMGDNGAYPGESRWEVRRRYRELTRQAVLSGSVRPSPWTGLEIWLVSKFRGLKAWLNWQRRRLAE